MPYVKHSFFERIPKFFPSFNILKCKPRIILKLFLNAKGVSSPNNLANIFQSSLMFYYIIKLNKSLYFVSIKQKWYYNCDAKASNVLMKFELLLRII